VWPFRRKRASKGRPIDLRDEATVRELVAVVIRSRPYRQYRADTADRVWSAVRELLDQDITDRGLVNEIERAMDLAEIQPIERIASPYSVSVSVRFA
jgi:hypothetical protein